MKFISVFFSAFLMMILIAGCGNSAVELPLSYNQSEVRATDKNDNNHHLWGLWQFVLNPESGTINTIPLRSAKMHLNAVPLLEPPAGLRIKISNVSFNGPVCDVDVTLVHPFPGLNQYIGFDVAGILITKGTLGGFHDPDIIMAGPGESRLLNADGYSRWWNPVEFDLPGQKIFRYRDGLLGIKNSTAQYDATLNGYKLFGDELAKNTDILSLNPATRLPFSPGTANTRHYTIDFSGKVVFNYAVDVSWEFPKGSAPYTIDDYSPDANRPEAWAISITEVENTLYNTGSESGGNLKLNIDVWDHYNAGLNKLWFDSPGCFDFITVTNASGGGTGYSTYQVEILNADPKPDSIDILIGVESEVVGYHDLLSDDHVTAYFVYSAKVASSIPGIPPTAILKATTATEIDICSSVSFDASESTGTPPLTFEWDFNGDSIYNGPEDVFTGSAMTPTHYFTKKGTYNVTVKVSNSYGSDISDPVVVKVGLNPDGIYVDGDYTGGNSDGSMNKPFTTINEAMAIASAGTKIHVDYLESGNKTYDTTGLTLKSGVKLLGSNWQDCTQPKPRITSESSGKVLFGQNVSNILIEGFEIIVPAGPSFPNFVMQPSLAGIHLYDTNAYNNGGSTNNNTIRRCHFTGEAGITAGYYAIHLEGAFGTIIELNEFGSIIGLGSTNILEVCAVYSRHSDNNTIRQNWVHDLIADMSTSGSGQIGVFYHCWGDNLVLTNNLVHNIKSINGPSNIYPVFVASAEGTYNSSHNPIFANNTIDNIDAGNGVSLIYGLGNNTPGVYSISNIKCFNNIVSNTFGSPSSRAFSVVGQNPADPAVANFCNAFNTAWMSQYGGDGYLNFIKGTGSYGNWNNPQNPNYISAPANYDLQTTSTSQYGDPSIVDWDDTGSPSNNPSNTDINTRSRMGAFGGPAGNWWPLK